MEFIPEVLFGASYRKSLTTLFPRFLKAMAAYHEDDVCGYFKDAFGFEGDIAESVDKMVALFTELGVDMYFDGSADEEQIRKIPVDSVLSMNRRVRMIGECMRNCAPQN